MIIEELIICNFKNYPGVNTIDLSTSTNLSGAVSKNIVLIGGLNGSGKTSFSEAIRLCLYGDKINGKIMSKKDYQNYLKRVCSKQRGEQIEYFFISSKVVIDEYSDSITVKREFTKKKDEFVENLTLTKNDSCVEIVDENYWSYFVEKLIPPNISQYFFFDGEQVRKAISSENSTEYLRSSISDLTGIRELTDLKKDLEVVRKNIISRNTKKTQRQIVNSLENQIAMLKKQNINFGNSKQHEEKNKESMNLKINLNEEKIKRIVGSNETIINNIKNQIVEKESDYEKSDQEIVKFCNSKLPFILSSNRLEKTIELAKKENDATINQYTFEKVQSVVSNIKTKLSNSNVCESDMELIFSELMEELKTDLGKNQPILDMTLNKIMDLEKLRFDNAEVQRFLDILNQRETVQYEINDLKQSLKKIDSRDIEKIVDDNKELAAEMQLIDVEIKRIQDIIDNNEATILDLESKVRKEEQRTMIKKADQSSISTIESISLLIEERIKKIKERAIIDLNYKINEIYPILKNKKDMVKEITVTEDYELTLWDYDDNKVDTNDISEGEKGILMYSVVYGLTRISDTKMPLIIDSPLGRMDSYHVKNLIERYFPVISNQTIILSHDREIDHKNYELIRDSLSRSYTLTNDTTNKVKDGYFGV